ncbi:hypothetical protein QYF36_019726 [Acer negundo]|nr:hypothetical protein QYF36_019726 [Acer negundo]
MRQAINNSRNIDCLVSMVRIGVACSMESPQDRMNINHALNELQSVKNILLQPPKPGRKSKLSSNCYLLQPSSAELYKSTVTWNAMSANSLDVSSQSLVMWRTTSVQ